MMVYPHRFLSLHSLTLAFLHWQHTYRSLLPPGLKVLCWVEEIEVLRREGPVLEEEELSSSSCAFSPSEKPIPSPSSLSSELEKEEDTLLLWLSVEALGCMSSISEALISMLMLWDRGGAEGREGVIMLNTITNRGEALKQTRRAVDIGL